MFKGYAWWSSVSGRLSGTLQDRTVEAGIWNTNANTNCLAADALVQIQWLHGVFCKTLGTVFFFLFVCFSLAKTAIKIPVSHEGTHHFCCITGKRTVIPLSHHLSVFCLKVHLCFFGGHLLMSVLWIQCFWLSPGWCFNQEYHYCYLYCTFGFQVSSQNMQNFIQI